MSEVPVKESPRDRLKEITDSIERGIQELFDSDRYKQYLQTMSRFHNYSLNNVMLISMQRPDATHVAGYGKWQTAFSRHVKKGEKGIKIIAPTPYKKKVEEMLIDPDTKQPLRGPDGELLKQEVEVVIPHFRAVTVFDVSQTDGKPLPTLAQNLTASVQNYEVMLEALKRTSPVPISIEPIHDGSDGFYSHASRSITVKEGMSESQTVSTTIHEIAHAKLHSRPDVQLDHTAPRYQLAEIMGQEVLFSNGHFDRESLPDGLYCYDLREGDSGYAAIIEPSVAVNHFGSIITTQPIEFPETGYIELNEENGLSFGDGEEMSIYEFVQHSAKDRRTKEVEAESVAYAVCQYYGIETADNSFGYIASWSKGRELAELRSSLETINKTSAALIDTIDRHFAEICAERGITVNTEQRTEDLYLVDNSYYVHLQANDVGWDYTIYDRHSLRQMDGGVLDSPVVGDQVMARGITEARDEVLNLQGIPGDVIESVDLDMVSTLQDAQSEKPQEATLAAMEQSFLDLRTDSYAIYQLRDDGSCDDLHWMAMADLQKAGHSVERQHYALVYADELNQYPGKSVHEVLNDLYYRFNHEHPPDFHGHSLSVSDMVALRHEGKLQCFYVDRWGFAEV
ncbi:MAG: hypothetical protein II989_02690, partial [Bacteroidales bacterium]|nr:hypothetical protein [Bacteroidales bacterium]